MSCGLKGIYTYIYAHTPPFYMWFPELNYNCAFYFGEIGILMICHYITTIKPQTIASWGRFWWIISVHFTSFIPPPFSILWIRSFNLGAICNFYSHTNILTSSKYWTNVSISTKLSLNLDLLVLFIWIFFFLWIFIVGLLK